MAWLPYVLGYLAVGFFIGMAVVIKSHETKQGLNLTGFVLLVLMWPSFLIVWLMN